MADSDKQQFADVSAQAQNVHKTKFKLFVYCLHLLSMLTNIVELIELLCFFFHR